MKDFLKEFKAEEADSGGPVVSMPSPRTYWIVSKIVDGTMNKTIKYLAREDETGLLRIRRVSKDAAVVERELNDETWEAVDDAEAARAYERALLELTDAVEELIGKLPELRVPAG